MFTRAGSRTAVWGVALCLMVVALAAAHVSYPAAQPSRTSTASAAVPNPSFLKSLRWRSIGPFRGGRSLAVAGDPASRSVFYFGSVGGGVWKTEDAGYSWTNISDGEFATGAVGAIAVAESDPSVIYAGMGEVCIRGNVSHGDGVYRSADAGKTWTHVGLEKTRHIGRIRIHPKDANLVYVAALGDAWGPNPDRGLYRSKDGGATWSRVLFVNDGTGVVDLAMDPADPRVLYAAAWEAQRYPWGVRSGGPGSGLYKSTDGGDTWASISRHPGLPTSVLGRIGLAIAPKQPDRVWAIIDALPGQIGIYRTDDAGARWQMVSDDGDLVTRPFYYSHIYADSQDPEAVYVLNVGMWKSTDGGRTFKAMRPPHGDHHDLWIDPNDARRFIEANDGGATVSLDGGRSWSTQYNQPTAQMYHVTTDTRFPYRVYGAQQDNSTISIPSRSEIGRIGESDYYTVGGGESGYIAVKPNDPDIVYAGDHFWVSRYDHRTRDVKWISVWPEMWYGWGARDVKYRFYWTYPIVVSPHDPTVLYATSQYVHRTNDEGQSWEVISPDLARADPSKLERTPRWGNETIEYYWGPTSRQTNGDHWYAMIFTFAESPVQKGVLWAGTDDGYVQVSRDGGRSWKNVTPKGMPEWALVSIIDPSPHDAASAYVAATRYKLQDRRPYLYKTNDYGATWTLITEGIPPDDFTRVIREDPKRRGLLYAGTETGVYVSFNDGAAWQALRLNLPVVPIHDMVRKDQDLVVATHGRGFWILDQAALLHQFTPDVLSTSVHLFEPQTTVRFRESADPAVRRGPDAPTAANPPSGVTVQYYLREAPASEVTLTFLDKGGQVLHAFSSKPDSGPRVQADAGGNRFVWDTRYPGPFQLPGAVYKHHEPQGPLAPPGTYTVSLTVEGKTIERSFAIVKDPRVSTTPEQFEEKHRLLIGIRDKITAAHETVKRIRAARDELKGLASGKARTDVGARVEGSAKAIIEQLWQIEDELIQFRATTPKELSQVPPMLDDKLSTLGAFVESSDLPATTQDRALFGELAEAVDKQVVRFERLERTELAALRRLVASDQY